MEKILDIHIIYCDKDKEYLEGLLEQCKNFKIVNARNNWKIFVYAHEDLPFSEGDTTDGKHFLSIFHLYVIIIFRS